MNKKLCYIEDNFAYFTSDFDNQWGDDWNDVPYEHNAGFPYDRESEIEVIAFMSNLSTPAERAGINSPYSVKDINNQLTPWLEGKVYSKDELLDGSKISIFAGISMEDFISILKETGGRVFLEDRDNY